MNKEQSTWIYREVKPFSESKQPESGVEMKAKPRGKNPEVWNCPEDASGRAWTVRLKIGCLELAKLISEFI